MIMNKSYIGLGVLLFFISCSGDKSRTADSLSENESIVIDESTRISPDSATATKKDSIENNRPQIKFSSADNLKDYLRNSPNREAYSQGIIPLIADYSLEYAEKLVNNSHDGFIIVDKSRMKVIYYDKFGREKLNYGMACARNYGTKHKKADSRTPEGFFTAEGIYNSTDWLYTDDNGRTHPAKGQFGPRFIRLKCPNTSQIGIHGTAAPGSIGRRASHGCIRVKNENILELVKYAKVGMPIIVVPGGKDMGVNNSEGVKTVWIPSSRDAVAPTPGVPDVIEKTKDKNAITQDSTKLIKNQKEKKTGEKAEAINDSVSKVIDTMQPNQEEKADKSSQPAVTIPADIPEQTHQSTSETE